MSERHKLRANTASFKLATGAASLFIVVASTLGLTLDRLPDRVASWSLRGSIAPEASGPPKPIKQNNPARSRAALQVGTVPV